MSLARGSPLSIPGTASGPWKGGFVCPPPSGCPLLRALPLSADDCASPGRAGPRVLAQKAGWALGEQSRSAREALGAGLGRGVRPGMNELARECRVRASPPPPLPGKLPAAGFSDPGQHADRLERPREPWEPVAENTVRPLRACRLRSGLTGHPSRRACSAGCSGRQLPEGREAPFRKTVWSCSGLSPSPQALLSHKDQDEQVLPPAVEH